MPGLTHCHARLLRFAEEAGWPQRTLIPPQTVGPGETAWRHFILHGHAEGIAAALTSFEGDEEGTRDAGG